MVGRIEISKDVLQEVAESTATHVGTIASIITGAVKDVIREVGSIATDVFEAGDAAKKARNG
jgi:uncharacterized alkaline shock family protein YloU